jgi:hypothetical protein
MKLPPVTVTAEMASLQFPVFVTVTVCVLLVPTVTFPKSMLAEVWSCRFLPANAGIQEKQMSAAKKSPTSNRFSEVRLLPIP